MAKLSNINGKFAVEDTGAIRFSDQTGTTGQILKSNGNSAPTWVDPNTVGTGPWLPLAGGIVSGSTTFQSGLTVGGTLAVNGNLDVTSTSSDAVFLRSSQATTTNVYITNTNATVNNTANLYFAPANNIAGSYIKSTAIEDFSTSANRTSDLRFAVRKDGTFNEAIIINSSGNVGIGITPNVNSSVVNVIQLGKGMTLMGNANDDRATMAANLYLDTGTAFRYVMDGLAGRFSIEDGNMVWGTASSGTAGTVATADTKMTLLNNGNLGIGRTAPDYKLVVSNNNAEGIEFGPGYISGCNLWQNYNRTTSTYVKETHYGSEYHFMPAGGATGNVGINTTSPSAKLEIKATGASSGLTFKTTDSSNNEIFYIKDGGVVGVRYYPFKIGVPSTTSNVPNTRFQIATTGGDFVVLNDGKTGIGTDSPTGKLNVEASGNHLHLRANTATAGKYWNFDITSNNQLFIINNGGTGMTIKDDGNVGIGTTSPSTRLSVTGSEDGALEFTTTLGSTKVPSGTNGSLFTAPRNKTILTGYSTVYTGVSGAALAPSGFLQFNSGPGWTGSQRNWAITSGYDIGGTQSGAGGNKLAILMGNTQNFNPELGNNGAVGAGTGDGVGTSVACYWDNALNMNLSASSRIRMGGGGSAGLPMLTPLNDKNTGIWYPTSDTWAISTAGDERMRITSAGHILFGNTTASITSDPGFKYIKNTNTPYFGYVVNTSSGNGYSNFHHYNTNSTFNGFRFYILNNGGIVNYSSNNVNLSDERVKNNIENSGNYLDKICSIPVRLFNYKDEPEGTDKNLGVIAQEVEAVAPELVNNDGFGETPEDGIELKTVYSTDMMYALMKAIQELKADNDILKSRIKILENK